MRINCIAQMGRRGTHLQAPRQQHGVPLAVPAAQVPGPEVSQRELPQAVKATKGFEQRRILPESIDEVRQVHDQFEVFQAGWQLRRPRKTSKCHVWRRLSSRSWVKAANPSSGSPSGGFTSGRS